MKKLIAFSVLFLAGCSQLQPVLERSSGKVAEGVDTYCQETDETFRAEFRAEVNSKTNGATIIVTCP